MQLKELELGTLKLDAGAMFGVVPKVMWSAQYPADEDNLATLAMRSLLIEDGGQLILIDTGAGDKQPEKFRKIYHLEGSKLLERAVHDAGYALDQVTDIILTHLHFDHCGGATRLDEETGKSIPTFPKATYHIGKEQWKNATKPNPLEKASFIPDNYIPLMEAGQVQMVEQDTKITSNVSVRLVHGHTPGQLLPIIQYKDKVLVYLADLIPIMPQIPLSWICAYDVEPLKSVKEKDTLLKEALENQYTLFSEHDYYNTCCQLENTEKGIRASRFFSLQEFLNS
jgi:glyoxylase-like metal-dependent hydrolase (beta-lactamase superfamily II)